MSEKYSVKEALESTETTATVLHAILRNQYGDEVYEWDPITVALEVSDDFGAEMSSESISRFSAMQLIMVNNAFFQRLDAFMGVCNTLGTGDPFFNVFDPVTVEEAAWAITECALNREMLPFSYTIKKFLKIILAEEGYGTDYPDIFDAVFEADTPQEAKAIREQIRESDDNPNTANINAYIDDELTDMVHQFNKIPSIARIDDILLASDTETLVGAL